MRREDIKKPEISLVDFDTDTTILDPTYIRIKVEVCVSPNSSNEYIEELQKLYGEITLDAKTAELITKCIKDSLGKPQQSEIDSPKKLYHPVEIKEVPLRFGREFLDRRIHYEWFRKKLGYIAIYDHVERKEKVTEEEKKAMENKVNLDIGLVKALIIFNNESIEIPKRDKNVFIYNYELSQDEPIKYKVALIRGAIEKIVETIVKEAYDILNITMEYSSFKMRIEEEEDNSDDDDEVVRNREGRFQKWKLDHCMIAQEHDLAEKVLDRAKSESEAKKDPKWTASNCNIQATILYKRYSKSKLKGELERAIACLKRLIQIYKEENLPDLYAEGVVKLLKLYKEHNLLPKAFELLKDIEKAFSKLSNTGIYSNLYDFLIDYARSIGASKKVVYYCYKLAEVSKDQKKKRLSYITQGLEGLEVSLNIDKLIKKNYKKALKVIKMLEDSANSLEERRDRSLSVNNTSFLGNKNPIITSDMEEPPWPSLFLTLVDIIFNDGLKDSISLSLYFLK